MYLGILSYEAEPSIVLTRLFLPENALIFSTSHSSDRFPSPPNSTTTTATPLASPTSTFMNNQGILSGAIVAPVAIPKYIEVLYNENDNQAPIETSETECLTASNYPHNPQSKATVKAESQPYEIPLSGVLVIPTNHTTDNSNLSSISSNRQLGSSNTAANLASSNGTLGRSSQNTSDHTRSLNNVGLSGETHISGSIQLPQSHNSNSNFSSLVSNSGGDDSMQTLLSNVTHNI